MQDPTREELDTFMASHPYAEELGDFEREAAIYWFANDWHGGQGSNLYAVLSQSDYQPGPLESGCEGSILYEDLEAHFG